MNLLDSILDIVFPRYCVCCKKSGNDLCLDCLCSIQTAERESAKWIFPIYDYRNPKIKKAIWMFKYSKKKRLANIFSEILYERIIEELADLGKIENFKEAILIPIPLSIKRHRERGFNQSLLICKKLINIDKRAQKSNKENIKKSFELLKNILIKIKDLEHQARIENRQNRLNNIIGSFVVKNKEKIKNKNIILIDDVTTTGATLSEAKKVLKQAGARKVIAFTIAH